MRNHLPNRDNEVPNKFNRSEPLPAKGRSGKGRVKTRKRHRRRY